VSVPIARRESDSPRRAHRLLDHWVFTPVRWLLRRWRRATPRAVELAEVETKMDQLIEGAEQGRPFEIVVDGKPVIKVARIEKEELDRLPKAEDS